MKKPAKQKSVAPKSKTNAKAKSKAKRATPEPKAPRVKSTGDKLKSEWWKFQKGRAKTGGRIKGTQNKINVAVADALNNTYEGLGGDEALKAFALDHPEEFFKLWAKMLPKEIIVGAIVAQVATLTPAEAKKLITDMKTGIKPKPKPKSKSKAKTK